MDDEIADADFAAALQAAERSYAPKSSSATAPGPGSPSSAPRVQQPKPQALPARQAPSSILVSPRQKGNPILNNIHSVPWEYSDIPGDYSLGKTTCALFLSLKYHRLHPEYIYSRIRALGHLYSLRVLLTMVDIANHEDSLKELSKTSLINDLTLILCWSAQEAGRYLELFKSYENANPSSIRAQQATGFNDKLVEFITMPRSINKTDAVGLISNFGSLATAVNARPEEVGLVAGWGEKKVQQWCGTVREPFRVKKAARRGIASRDNTVPETRSPREEVVEGERRPGQPSTSRAQAEAVSGAADWVPGPDEEEAMLAAMEDAQPAPARPTQSRSQQPADKEKDQGKQQARPNEKEKDGLSEGLAAALARLRDGG
ncbi:MAG: ssDNA endonuclease and repair protein rad10 [Thelocarpon impressellum]|nr:MAG: ssDNA endonuclease and repair protein rad10 [Thelocarpon impressellum]